jgi:hypothetical protein
VLPSAKFIPKSMTGSDWVEAVTVTVYPALGLLNVPLMAQPVELASMPKVV